MELTLNLDRLPARAHDETPAWRAKLELDGEALRHSLAICDDSELLALLLGESRIAADMLLPSRLASKPSSLVLRPRKIEPRTMDEDDDEDEKTGIESALVFKVVKAFP